jgi:hypothetical protein
MRTSLQPAFFTVLLFYSLITSGQSNKSNDYWLSFVDTTKNKCGYLNQNGDTVIQAENNFCLLTLSGLMQS